MSLIILIVVGVLIGGVVGIIFKKPKQKQDKEV